MTLQDLYKTINEYYGVDISIFSQKDVLVYYRKYYCLLATMYTNKYNYKQIGLVINRNHCTITTSIKTLLDVMSVDKFIVMEFENLENEIQNKYPYIVKNNTNYIPKRKYKYIQYQIMINKLTREGKYKTGKICSLRKELKKLREFKEILKNIKSIK